MSDYKGELILIPEIEHNACTGCELWVEDELDKCDDLEKPGCRGLIYVLRTPENIAKAVAYRMGVKDND